MYKLHSLQHPDWYRTGTSYCYCYIFEIFHHDSVIFSKTYPSFLTVKEGDFRILPSPFSQRESVSKTYPSFLTVKEGSTFLTKPLFNSLYAPFGSPSSGGQKPQGRKDVTALSAISASPVPPQREGPYPIPKP